MVKLLLVEDNEMNRDMLARRLRRYGYTVLVATDGQEGLKAACRELPDLILMDMSLPVIDGWALSRLLKSDPATKQIPLLALTAHAMDGDRERALSAGCDEYDTKPVEIKRLLGKMATLLNAPIPAALEAPRRTK